MNSQNILNYHILLVKTLPVTNTQPCRVKLVSERFKQSKVLHFDNDPGDAAPTMGTAVRYLLSKGFNIIGKGEGEGANHYYIITDTFEPLS